MTSLRHWLLLALPIPLLGAVCAATQVGYISSPISKFLDADESSQAYVLGLSTSVDEEAPSTPHRTLHMRSANGTLYRCFLPPAEELGDAAGTGTGSSSPGSSATSVTSAAQQQGLLGRAKKPSELLTALADHCFYYHEDWWSYEVCYKKHVRQYHKTAEGRMEGEFLLGVYDELEQPVDEDAVQVDASDVSGGMRYIAQLYSGGEACDLTGEARQAEVRFTCAADGAAARITTLQEPSSCRYAITVATPRLCKHPEFQDQPQAAALIRCHLVAEEGEAGSAPGAGQCGGAAADATAAAAAAAEAEGAVPGMAEEVAVDGSLVVEEGGSVQPRPAEAEKSTVSDENNTEEQDVRTEL